MSEPDPHDPLWKLLGHASRSEPSPYFARQVVREVRRLAGAPSWWRVLVERLHPRPRILFASSFAAVAAMALVVAIQKNGASRPDAAATGGLAEFFDPASEMVAVEYLGQLMAVADPGQLDDAALADLFF